MSSLIPNGRGDSSGHPASPGGPNPAGPNPGPAIDWHLSRHARRLLTLALAALFVAVITRRPEFAGVAAPALLILAVPRMSGPSHASVTAALSSVRVFEGEQVAIDLSVTLAGEDDYSASWLLQPGMLVEPLDGVTAEGATARFLVSPERWGRRGAGSVTLTLRDRWRLREGSASVPLPSMDCYPHPAQQRDRVVLSRLPNRLGEHRARISGDGIEFAGVREYVPGDRQRQINWAASTRRGRLMVNTQAAERSQDVVLLVDATSDVGEPGSSALDLELRGASAAARAYLDGRDRVGVITYQWGGALWRAPALGQRQQYRIIDTLLSSSGGGRGGGRGSRGETFRRLPRAALPDGTLVIVFSPLLDQRFTETLRDMRERGFTLLVVDVLNAEPPHRWRSIDRLAKRVWLMEQEAIRFSLRELGIPVVHWDGVQPLDLPLAPYTRRPMMVRR
jgi:uncharacterized protein (DUF58 family)